MLISEVYKDTVTVYEQSDKILQKVKISGGGRCNVTHACYEAQQLVQYYPRGAKALRGAFERFGPQNMVEWLQIHGVALKTELDGRIFPVSDSSSSIIDCFKDILAKNNVEIKYSANISQINYTENTAVITVKYGNESIDELDFLLICGGGSPKLWTMLSNLSIDIVTPVPSLFTFNTKDTLFRDLSGLSVPNANISIVDTRFSIHGAVLITHWGLSGPAILKLSAMAARHLAEIDYNFTIKINWLNEREDETLENLKSIKLEHGKKNVYAYHHQLLPSRLWKSILLKANIENTQNWADLNNKQLQTITQLLCSTTVDIFGKSTNKEEFVTAGGVALTEIDFKTMSSKRLPRLYFAGEVLDIDGYTGGFNFQAAWTTAWIAAHSLIMTLNQD